MRNLHLVGFTKDRKHLIFSTRKGAKSGSFLVPVDDDLLEAVDDIASLAGRDPDDEASVEVERTPPVPRAESQLSVREVQARLRAGDSVSAVATEAGVDPEWVERFAQPVRAEQRRVVERAMGARLERPRAGASAVSLRTAVAASMVEREISMSEEQFDAAWSAHLLGSGEWLVGFTFKARGGRRTLNWHFTPSTGRLTSKDRFATQLGFRSADDPLPSTESMFGEEPAPEPGAVKRLSGGLAYPGTTPTSAATVRQSAAGAGGPAARTIATTSTPPVAARTTAPSPRRPPAPGPRPPSPSAPRTSSPPGSVGSPGSDAGTIGRAPSDRTRRDPPAGTRDPADPRRQADDVPRGPAPAGPVGPSRPPVPSTDSRPASGPIDPAQGTAADAAFVPDRRPAPPVASRTPAPVVADTATTSEDDIPPSLRLIPAEDNSSIRVMPRPGDGDGRDDEGGGSAVPPARGQRAEDDHDDRDASGAADDDFDETLDDTVDDGTDDAASGAGDAEEAEGTAEVDAGDDGAGGDDDGASEKGLRRTGRVRLAISGERTRAAVAASDRDVPVAEELLAGDTDGDPMPEEKDAPARGDVSPGDDPEGDGGASDGVIDWSEPTRRRLKPLGEEDITPVAERTRRRTGRRQVPARAAPSATIRANRASASGGEVDGTVEAPSSTVAPGGDGNDAPKRGAASGPSKRRRRREPLRAR